MKKPSLRSGGGNATVTLLIMMAILLVLGMFLDWVGVARKLCQSSFQSSLALVFDPVWFGVNVHFNMQVSFLPSPPFGPAAFYFEISSTKDISLGEIFSSLLPFIALQVLVLALVIIFPQLALWWQ
ncbi:TRAP transporter large permease subunit [Vibrio lentus]|nr:TRAP transporter large permease subunit [Vibrio lentus]